MTKYWLRIVAGMLLIFTVGMGLVSFGRGIKHKISESSDPITLPIAFVPFKLDGQKLGDVDKIVLLRQDPKHLSGVRVLVSLSDSQSLDQLQDCVMAIDNVDRLNNQSTFRCHGEDTSGMERFGVVVVKGSSDSFPLLLPADAVRELRSTMFDRHDRRMRDAMMADSMEEAQNRLEEMRNQMADSIENVAEQRADSISAAATRLADSIRNSTRAERRHPIPAPPTPPVEATPPPKPRKTP